ncbi:MAG: hypothetical protein ACRC31_01170 [Cetobacterium sp.]
MEQIHKELFDIILKSNQKYWKAERIGEKQVILSFIEDLIWSYPNDNFLYHNFTEEELEEIYDFIELNGLIETDKVKQILNLYYNEW